MLPDSKSHERQVLQTKAAPPGHAQLPPLHTWPEPHAVQPEPHALLVFGHVQVPPLQVRLPVHVFVQLPQWLLSLPCTLMQPLVPQSVAGAEQVQLPDEQVLPPEQI
jgi:hypothetical protein